MNSHEQHLARLCQVELRQIWTSESGDFTPWLADEENLSLLGDTIGTELELEAQEKDVGPFRADILCKDTATGDWVLIENQLERTDHTHLGQLLTYAAGLKAVTIVWIAGRFTEEHRAALDWLNEITDDRFNFFGLEVELWKIADSPVAPKFNVACKPNDWTKTVARGASQVQNSELTDRKKMQLEFWTDFREYVREHGSKIKPTKPLPQHWMNVAIGRSGFNLAAIASFFDNVSGSYETHELRTELILSDENSKAYFEMLEKNKSEFEAELKTELTWHKPPDKKMCRIYVRYSADLDNRSRWPEYHEWLLKNLEAFHRTFSGRIKKLEVHDLRAEHLYESEAAIPNPHS